MTGPVPPPRLLVVGLGSPDRGDDAVGPVVARRFAALALPGIRVIEREDPTSLIDLWGGYDVAVVIDAVRSTGVPGSLVVLESGGDAGPLPEDAWARTGRGGTHAFGLAASVELSRALDRLPRRVVLVGILAAGFEPGEGLSQPVDAAVGRAVDAVVAVLWETGELGGTSVADADPDGPARPLVAVRRVPGVTP